MCACVCVCVCVCKKKTIKTLLGRGRLCMPCALHVPTHNCMHQPSLSVCISLRHSCVRTDNCWYTHTHVCRCVCVFTLSFPHARITHRYLLNQSVVGYFVANNTGQRSLIPMPIPHFLSPSLPNIAGERPRIASLSLSLSLSLSVSLCVCVCVCV